MAKNFLALSAITGLSIYFASLLPASHAQETITLYNWKAPDNAETPTGELGAIESALKAAEDSKSIVQVAPVAVGGDGATFYRAVEAQSIVASVRGDQLATVHLPTPTTNTYTFRADASRIHQKATSQSMIAGVTAAISYSSDCTHDVDSDTPVEEGVMVCNVKLEASAQVNKQAIITTSEGVVTGVPTPWATVVNSEGLVLPSAEPEGEEDGSAMSKAGAMVPALLITMGICAGLQLTL
ncbi:hypothetical protein CC1G_04854 [Coprinopsis cinerea okayama7|uniref:Uncharacterized protein n=1 Tax=Coprinopsis cinerea (strain Okayama-7 / 130 / ATCC MYA-4618 / FGSC 9003) TaxID=240176 RepID=A8PFT6_COPC7|nr:hypothetical protein CC1G_04854 [Coprinopsis cinerea okayama7\|eukprot:XP_001841010.1 hypothetical protein CC1G_04854 [Coprinopsis cinerea okayama7\